MYYLAIVAHTHIMQLAVSARIDIWQVQAKTNCTLYELLPCPLELYKSQYFNNGIADPNGTDMM